MHLACSNIEQLEWASRIQISSTPVGLAVLFPGRRGGGWWGTNRPPLSRTNTCTRRIRVSKLVLLLENSLFQPADYRFHIGDWGAVGGLHYMTRPWTLAGADLVGCFSPGNQHQLSSPWWHLDKSAVHSCVDLRTWTFLECIECSWEISTKSILQTKSRLKNLRTVKMLICCHEWSCWTCHLSSSSHASHLAVTILPCVSSCHEISMKWSLILIYVNLDTHPTDLSWIIILLRAMKLHFVAGDKETSSHLWKDSCSQTLPTW